MVYSKSGDHVNNFDMLNDCVLSSVGLVVSCLVFLQVLCGAINDQLHNGFI